MPRILYVNYASIEAEFVLQLVADLKNSGVGVWMDRLQLPATADWVQRGEQALERASGMLVVLSPDWFRSHYCQREYALARARGLAIFAVTLRPIAEHEYPAGVDTRRVLDFSEWRSPETYQESYRRLMARIKEDSREWVNRQPDDETRYMIQLVARMEANQGALEYAAGGGRQHHSTEMPQRTAPRLAALWGASNGIVALDKIRHAPTAEPRWRRTAHADLKAVLGHRPRAILLGSPGMGKTAALQRLALDAARARLADKNLPVPLYVNLAHWTETQSFEDFLVSRAPMLRHVVDMAAEGSAILFIDGLNEITQNVAARVLQIRAWLSSDRAPRRALFGCRTRSYDDTLDLDLPILELEPLTDEAIWRIIHALVGEVQGEAAYRRICAPESVHPMDIQTRELARNPMLLTGLVFLYKSSPESTLPSTMGGLLKRWMANLWIWRRMQNMPGWIPYVDVEAALAKIAFEMVQYNLPTGLTHQRALNLVLNDKLLRAAQNAGLIEVEADTVAFRQPLLSEYFAAVGAQSYLMSANLQPPHFNRWGERVATRWDQVFIIQAGLTPNADVMIGEIASVDPFLAAQVLAGGVEASTEAREQALKLLVEITHFVTGEGRLAAVRALADLNHPETLLALLDVMRSGTWQVRQAANWLLHRLPLPLPKDLFNAVSDWNWSMDERVAVALRQVGVQALPLLLQVLRDEHWSRRRGAAWALGEIRDAAAVPGLIEALADEENVVRVEAARALRHIGDLDSLPMLIDALRDPDGRVRRAVLDAVLVFKSAALDGLMDLLRDGSVVVKMSALEALAQLGDERAADHVVALVKDKSPEIRAAAAAALGKMGRHRDVPVLITLLDDKVKLPGKDMRVSDIAASALSMFDDEAARAALEKRRTREGKQMPPQRTGSAHEARNRLPGRQHSRTDDSPLPQTQLADKLHDPDWRMRKWAVEQFAALEAAIRVPALLQALHDDDSQVRYAALLSLEGARGDAVIWGLLDTLRDPDHLVADAASMLLGRLGRDAVPELLNALVDDDVNVRGRAIEALGRIGDPSAVLRLIPLLEDTAIPSMERERICDKAAAALELIGSDDAVAALLKWRGETRTASDERVPEPASAADDRERVLAGAMESVDENSDLRTDLPDELLPHDEADSMPVSEPFDHEDMPLAQDEFLPDEPFIIALTHSHLARMLETLHSQDWRQRQAAARELRDHTRQLGGIADEAFAAQLIAALDDSEHLVRWSVTEALAYVLHPTVPPALAGMLRDSSWTVRLAALRALYEHGDDSVVENVAEAMKDENELVRESAAEVLGKIGGGAAAVALLQALKDNQGFVRRSAAEALGEYKTAPPAVINSLVAALDDVEYQVRYASVESLGKLRAEAAVRPLAQLLRVKEATAWDERSLGEVAAEALERIGTPDALDVVEMWRAGNYNR
jgi:HEAT repeat protein